MQNAGMGVETEKQWCTARGRVHPRPAAGSRLTFMQNAGMGVETEEQKKEFLDESGQSYPLGRVGQPSDVASLTLFLADNERASWVTGACSFTLRLQDQGLGQQQARRLPVTNASHVRCTMISGSRLGRGEGCEQDSAAGPRCWPCFVVVVHTSTRTCRPIPSCSPVSLGHAMHAMCMHLMVADKSRLLSYSGRSDTPCLVCAWCTYPAYDWHCCCTQVKSLRWTAVSCCPNSSARTGHQD